MIQMKSALYLSAATLAAMAVSVPAMAQDEAESQERQTSGYGEIIVTAQRQAQSVLEVPLSIQALSGDQLSSSGIAQMSDLQLTTPGFVPSNASGYNQMFIRGIGNAIFVGADPSVATFIDEVPRVFGTLVNNFVDVERVEVIKGAPGALYGRNATGGAVNIITRQPDTEETSGKVKVVAGSKETYQVSAFLNLPFSENIAATLSGEYRSHDFYVKNLTQDSTPYSAAMFPVNDILGPGTASYLGTPEQTAAILNSGLEEIKGLNDEDFWAVSGKLLLKPTENLKITLAGDYSRKKDTNGNGIKNTTPDFGLGLLYFYLSDPTFGLGATNTTYQMLSPLATTVDKKFATAIRVNGDVDLKDWGFSGTAVLELPTMDITSITGYRRNTSHYYSELTSLAYALFGAAVDIKKKTFYQELRAVSTGDGPLHYIVGASYLRAQFTGGLTSDFIRPVSVGAPAGQGGYVVKNWSAFAQLTYDLTDNLSLMASGRYIHEKNDANQPTLPGPINLKEKKFLPAATLTYQLDGGGNIYARYARGFKAGGIVPVTNLAEFGDDLDSGGVFKGETVDTFEVGFRAPLADRRVNVTAAVFYNDYKNVQYAAHANAAAQARGVTITVVNAGSARTYGAEFDVNARATDALTLGASVAYLNAKYKDFVIEANDLLLRDDLSGQRMINSPEWQLSLRADLDQPVTDSLNVVANAVAAHTSSVIWQHSALPGVLDDATGNSFWLVNARLGVKSEDQGWTVALYAKNLFNAAYSTFGNSAAGYGNLYNWGDPRIIGVEASLNF